MFWVLRPHRTHRFTRFSTVSRSFLGLALDFNRRLLSILTVTANDRVYTCAQSHLVSPPTIMSKRPASPSSSTDTTALKKKRTLSSYTTRTCEAESTSFSQWAPSDIVILQAIGRAHPRDPSKIPVSFEASRGLLARESHVFSDMFHFPQPGIKSESTEQTTPTIEVFDDAEELEKFLEVVHDYR